MWKVLCNRSLPHAAQRHRRAVRQRSSRINQRQTRTPVDAERTFVRRITSDCEFSQPSSCRTRRAPARNPGKPVHSSELRPVLSPPSIQRRRTAVQSKHRRPLQTRALVNRAQGTPAWQYAMPANNRRTVARRKDSMYRRWGAGYCVKHLPASSLLADAALPVTASRTTHYAANRA